MQCACAILSSVACPVLQYFFTLSQTARFSKKEKVYLSQNVCFDFPYNFDLKHFSFYEELIIIIIIIMFMKVLACFLFLDPQDVVGPSISSSVVLRSFVPLVYIVVLVLVVYLCPSSVCL